MDFFFFLRMKNVYLLNREIRSGRIETISVLLNQHFPLKQLAFERWIAKSKLIIVDEFILSVFNVVKKSHYQYSSTGYRYDTRTIYDKQMRNKECSAKKKLKERELTSRLVTEDSMVLKPIYSVNINKHFMNEKKEKKKIDDKAEKMKKKQNKIPDGNWERKFDIM